MIVDVGKRSVHEVDGYHGDAGWDHKYGILADAVAKGDDHEYRANSEDDAPEQAFENCANDAERLHACRCW